MLYNGLMVLNRQIIPPTKVAQNPMNCDVIINRMQGYTEQQT